MAKKSAEIPRISVIPETIFITNSSTYRVEGQEGAQIVLKRLSPSPAILRTPVSMFTDRGIIAAPGRNESIEDVLPMIREVNARIIK